MSDLPSLEAPDPTWEQVADQITFATAYDRLWEPGPRGGAWFLGGELNLSVNCLDRQLAERADQVALHWEGEPGDRRSLTYGELHEQVLALTRALRSLGLGPGDRVGLHLGWLPETVVAMFACARIGAVHTVLPAPLPAEALADRLAGMELKVLFTQDGAWRHGTVLPLKARADEALSATESVEHTVVVRRTGMDVPWYEGDRWYHDLVAATRPGAATGDDEPLPVPSAHPVCTMPQANRRGEPILIQHGTAAALAASIAVHRQFSSGGVFWCAADITWVATQFHGIYGPLACGDTAVMFEGTLDIPTHERAWQIVQRYGVETVLTSPSVVRTIRGWARTMPQVSPMPTLRRMITAGEPVEEELTEWLVHTLGGGELELGDAWGQLELGGIVRVVGLPRSARVVPLPDCGLDIVGPTGEPVPDGLPGEAVLCRSWAGVAVGVEGGAASVSDARWTRYPGLYATGDRAVREPTGAGEVTFLGRTDDVVTISGQLVSLSGVREVLAEHPWVAATDVAVRKDPAVGRSIVAAVALKPEFAPDADLDEVAVDLMDNVREMMGGLARPRAVLFLDRFGDDLSRPQRAAAIVSLATEDRHPPRLVTWEQVLVAAGHHH
ncbi:MAG: acetate--CoA ligase [Actinomycetales bacterium]|nr:acetate--CoA ligase [Actinomycetales bacterium]